MIFSLGSCITIGVVIFDIPPKPSLIVAIITMGFKRVFEEERDDED
jgi:hypothetical protein